MDIGSLSKKPVVRFLTTTLLTCAPILGLVFSQPSYAAKRGPASDSSVAPTSTPSAPNRSPSQIGGDANDPNAQQSPAEPPQDPNAMQAPAPPSDSKINKSEEEDYATTPFTSYGEFNEDGDEEADSKFFQYGRFFGVSLGLGAEIIDGNRGALWQGGFPMVDFKLHYWFDFQLALDLGLYTAQQYFDTTVKGLGHVDVNMVHVGVDVKYYFQTKDLGSAVSFASPYLLAGVGGFSKTENSQAQGTQDNDNSLGVSIGGGLEFVISPRKSYFEIEGRASFVTFKNTYSTDYTSIGLPNLTGNFYTVSGSILFTW